MTLESLTVIILLGEGAPGLGARQVGVVGSARGEIGTAMVRALRTAVSHVQEVSVWDNIPRWERLLPLEHLQPLLHVPLELLMLQLLLLVNALRWRPRRGGEPQKNLVRFVTGVDLLF